MKKLIFLVTLFIGVAVFAQEATMENITNKDKVFVDADSMPEFPGGINGFRSKFTRSFDTYPLGNLKGKVGTEITFIIETDGSISEIKAIGTNTLFNNQAIKALKKIKDQWEPAKYKGTKVRYRYKMPLTMVFD